MQARIIKILQSGHACDIVSLHSKGILPFMKRSSGSSPGFPLYVKIIAGQAGSVMFIERNCINFWLTFVVKYTIIMNRRRTFVRVGG
jgi:hypothetical protein